MLPHMAVDSDDPTQSLEFLEFQPPSGEHAASGSPAADGPPVADSQPNATSGAQAASADGAQPQGGTSAAGATAVAEAAPSAPPQTPGSPAQNGDAVVSRRPKPIEGVELAEQLLDVIFVSSEAGAAS